ncbi:MAG: hypothetical protein HOE90_07080 [Bacteriovoracaceae bacterium]|jgi:hypothetical protein|nr:hypothetical protein [Bacteriovoracaceae bacterium]
MLEIKPMIAAQLAAFGLTSAYLVANSFRIIPNSPFFKWRTLHKVIAAFSLVFYCMVLLFNIQLGPVFKNGFVGAVAGLYFFSYAGMLLLTGKVEDPFLQKKQMAVGKKVFFLGPLVGVTSAKYFPNAFAYITGCLGIFASGMALRYIAPRNKIAMKKLCLSGLFFVGCCGSLIWYLSSTNNSFLLLALLCFSLSLLFFDQSLNWFFIVIERKDESL